MHEPLSDEQEQASDSALAILRQQVHEALGQLDETAREIVMLHYFSRLTHDDIAVALDLTVPAVHGRLQRARRKLAEILGPTGTTG